MVPPKLNPKTINPHGKGKRSNTNLTYLIEKAYEYKDINEDGSGDVKSENICPNLAAAGGDLGTDALGSSSEEGDREAGQPRNEDIPLEENNRAETVDVGGGAEIITLTGEDTDHCIPILTDNVQIYESQSSSNFNSGSNKAKIHPVVKFDWARNLYHGKIVANHKNEIHIAYMLKGKNGGIVRILNRHTSESCLIKCSDNKQIVDLSFAYPPKGEQSIKLATVDDMGTLSIYTIIQSENSIRADQTLLIHQTVQPNKQRLHRVVWCDYVPDVGAPHPCNGLQPTSNGASSDYDSDAAGGGGGSSSSGSDGAGGTGPAPGGGVNSYWPYVAGSKQADPESSMLILTNYIQAHIIYISMVEKYYAGFNDGKGINLDDIKVGKILLNTGTDKAITSISVAQDGTTAATAHKGGEVKFYQFITLQDEPAECIFKWNPHDGKTVTSLFFIDDHLTKPKAEIFWKFVITGACDNREYKLWQCETWNCLQTITLNPPPLDTQLGAMIAVVMDATGNYFICSDINRNVLMVFELMQSISETSKKTVCKFSSVTEVMMTQPCLNMAIINVEKSIEPSNMNGVTVSDEFNLPDDDDNNFFNNTDEADLAVYIKLNIYSIHTKSLQHLMLRFKSIMDKDSLASNACAAPSLYTFTTETNQPPESLLRATNSASFNDTRTSSLTNVTAMENSVSEGVFIAKQLSRESDVDEDNDSSTTCSSSSDARSSVEIVTDKDDNNDNIQDPTTTTTTPTTAVKSSAIVNDLYVSNDSLSISSDSNSENNEDVLEELEDLLKINVEQEYQDEEDEEEHISLDDSTATVSAANTTYLISDTPDDVPVLPPITPQTSDAYRYNAPCSAAQTSDARTSPPGTRNSSTRMNAELENTTSIYKEMLQNSSKLAIQTEKLKTTHSEELSELTTKLTTMEDTMRQNQVQHNKDMNRMMCYLENMSESFDKQNKTMQKHYESDKALKNQNQKLLKTITTTVEKTVKDILVPNIKALIQPIKNDIHNEISKTLTTTDLVLKNNITSMLRSKSTMDAISSGIGHALNAPLKRVILNEVIPGFKAGCKDFSEEINNSILDCINHYVKELNQVTKYLSGEFVDTLNPMIIGMEKLKLLLQQAEETSQASLKSSDIVYKTSSHLINVVDVYNTNMTNADSSLHETIRDAVKTTVEECFVSQRENINETLKTAISENIRAYDSDDNVSTYSTARAIQRSVISEEKIAYFINNKEYNEAFGQALMANNISLVLYACRKIAPKELFSANPCPLGLNVLLSLIQQLSIKLMCGDTKLMLSYLDEAILCLDLTNEECKRHIVDIIGSLERLLIRYSKKPDLEYSIMKSMKHLSYSCKYILEDM